MMDGWIDYKLPNQPGDIPTPGNALHCVSSLYNSRYGTGSRTKLEVALFMHAFIGFHYYSLAFARGRYYGAERAIC